MTSWPARSLPERTRERLERNLGHAMFATRWLLAPIYVGLLAALVILVIKFVQKLVLTFDGLLGLSFTDTTLAVLQLLDIALVANLVLIVMFSGWQNVIGPLFSEQPTSILGFGALKQTLIASIAAIAAISILETFMYVNASTSAQALWQVVILVGIGVTGVLLAWMDRLGGNSH